MSLAWKPGLGGREICWEGRELRRAIGWHVVRSEIWFVLIVYGYEYMLITLLVVASYTLS
jgi:hypothetical protein